MSFYPWFDSICVRTQYVFRWINMFGCTGEIVSMFAKDCVATNEHFGDSHAMCVGEDDKHLILNWCYLGVVLLIERHLQDQRALTYVAAFVWYIISKNASLFIIFFLFFLHEYKHYKLTTKNSSVFINSNHYVPRRAYASLKIQHAAPLLSLYTDRVSQKKKIIKTHTNWTFDALHYLRKNAKRTETAPNGRLYCMYLSNYCVICLMTCVFQYVYSTYILFVYASVFAVHHLPVRKADLINVANLSNCETDSWSALYVRTWSACHVFWLYKSIIPSVIDGTIVRDWIDSNM